MPVVKSPYTHLCIQPRKVPKNTARCLTAAPENTAHCRAHLGQEKAPILLGHQSSTYKHLEEFYMPWMFEFGLKSNPGSMCVIIRSHTCGVSLSRMLARGTEVRKNTCTKNPTRGRTLHSQNSQPTANKNFILFLFTVSSVLFFSWPLSLI